VTGGGFGTRFFFLLVVFFAVLDFFAVLVLAGVLVLAAGLVCGGVDATPAASAMLNTAARNLI
jgi:hypothetical protein